MESLFSIAIHGFPNIVSYRFPVIAHIFDIVTEDIMAKPHVTFDVGKRHDTTPSAWPILCYLHGKATQNASFIDVHDTNFIVFHL
ncbi:hypothetical protein [Segatella baroniae]|uniref:hypothetical protein n=1 Tax=Segatella baroniae TaxID=305719 RepID=UPI001F32E13E|nr:hypothetical protein [Segatella baroniae]